MTNSSLFTCSTGKSAGLTPLNFDRRKCCLCNSPHGGLFHSSSSHRLRRTRGIRRVSGLHDVPKAREGACASGEEWVRADESVPTCWCTGFSLLVYLSRGGQFSAFILEGYSIKNAFKN